MEVSLNSWFPFNGRTIRIRELLKSSAMLHTYRKKNSYSDTLIYSKLEDFVLKSPIFFLILTFVATGLKTKLCWAFKPVEDILIYHMFPYLV